MKERYYVIKKLYPNYLIYIKKKDKLKLFEVDKEITNIFNEEDLKNTNKLILNNLNIEEKFEYKNNNYQELLKKAILIRVLKEELNK